MKRSLQVILSGLAVGFTVLVVSALPDIRRYLKMRRM